MCAWPWTADGRAARVLNPTNRSRGDLRSGHRAAVQDIVVERRHVSCQRGPGEAPPDVLGGTAAARLPLCRAVDGVDHRAGERLEVVALDEPPGVAVPDDLR